MFVVEDMNHHNRQYKLLLLLYVCEKMYVRKIPPALHFNLIDISDLIFNLILI
jgi:hypothetical protein